MADDPKAGSGRPTLLSIPIVGPGGEPVAVEASHDPTLPPLDRLIAEALSHRGADPTGGWPGWYLLVLTRAGGAAPGRVFETVDVATLRREVAGRLSGVLAVRKRDLANPYASRITVGRARNNDLHIPDLSISKVHAWFVEEAAGARPVLRLRDGGSRNGTLGDGVRIGEAPAPLAPGAVVRFGNVECRFVDGAGLRAGLVAEAQHRSGPHRR